MLMIYELKKDRYIAIDITLHNILTLQVLPYLYIKDDKYFFLLHLKWRIFKKTNPKQVPRV